MKTTLKLKKEPTTFEDVIKGQSFIYNSILFVKTNAINDGTITYNAVDLNDGRLVSFGKDYPVSEVAEYEVVPTKPKKA